VRFSFIRCISTKTERTRSHYAYPPSPTSSESSLEETLRPVPLSHRLRNLQAELSALELELADPSNPLLQQEKENERSDFGELIRGVVDVKGRLEKIKKDKEGRGKLVGVILGDNAKAKEEETQVSAEPKTEAKANFQDLAEMDRRVGDLEKLVGSSASTLDEASECCASFVSD